jgi:uncharacterized protein (TIGR02001 family)
MNKGKQSVFFALAFFLCTSNNTFAAGKTATSTLSGNLSATSTYVWRGLPQTHDAAIQGGLDYARSNGPHAGLWTSNVKDGSELDITLGFAGSAPKGIQYDIGFMLYMYPQYEAAANPGEDYNFNEIYAEISKDMLSARFSTSPDAGDYLEVNANIEKLIADWDLGLHFGSYNVDTGFSGLPGKDYNDYNVSLGKRLNDFDLRFTLSDTNLPDDSYRTIITVGRDFKP